MATKPRIVGEKRWGVWTWKIYLPEYYTGTLKYMGFTYAWGSALRHVANWYAVNRFGGSYVREH